jgi:hypothetical protein
MCVCGGGGDVCLGSQDFLSAFDFAHPDYSWPSLPDTSNYVIEGILDCLLLPKPVIPTVQAMPYVPCFSLLSLFSSPPFLFLLCVCVCVCVCVLPCLHVRTSPPDFIFAL